MNNIICPLMSCRTTSMEEMPSNKAQVPKLTPTIVRCQESQCALWDGAENACAVKSIAMQLIKLGENK